MAEKKTPTNGPSNIDGKDMLKTIKEQLHIGLSSLREQLGEKKFEKRIKKAAKLLAAGIEKKPETKPEKKEAVIVKKTVAPAKKPIKAKKVAKKA